MIMKEKYTMRHAAQDRVKDLNKNNCTAAASYYRGHRGFIVQWNASDERKPQDEIQNSFD